jgi:predicted nucleic acid-binding protein
MTAILVIDTSYLLELFNVPGHSHTPAVEEIRRRYGQAIENRSRLYVPLPCLFELANHIAGVRDGQSRRQLATALAEQVEGAMEGNGEWILIPAPEVELFRDLWREFAENFAVQGVGLTDACVIVEAGRLKREHYTHNVFSVHIWTKDSALKAHEPDVEDDAFLG